MRTLSPRLLLINAYSVFNRGDAAIVIGMLTTIRELYPASDISIHSATPKEDAEYYSEYGAKTSNELLSLCQYDRRLAKSRLGKLAVATKLLLKAILYLVWTEYDCTPMNKTDRAILQEYRNADIIVSCGGGYLGGDKMWSTLFLFRIYLAKRMAKRVYLWGVSIEPFKEWILKEITRFVLRSVDIITVRETHSMKILKMLGISKCAFVTADAAFLTGCESLAYAAKTLSELGIPDTTILKIGMTLRRWHFPASDDPDERLLHYMNAISSALETMLREPGAIAILFPQSTVGPSDDDREISRKIRDMVREPMNRRIFILTDNYTPEQLKAMIGTVDVFIGTRMHSNIFAISMGVPTIAIAYELKSYGIMKMAGLERYVLDISSVTSEKIVHLVQEILQDRSSVTRRIKEELPGLKRESFRNGDFLGMLIGDCAKQGAHP